MNDVEKLMELKKAKCELIEAIRTDNEIEEKYEQYAMIYKKITNKSPKNSLESLIKVKNELKK